MIDIQKHKDRKIKLKSQKKDITYELSEYEVSRWLSLIESTRESNSAIAPETVPAVVPIAPDVIVTSSASTSLIAPAIGPAVVVNDETSPTESTSWLNRVRCEFIVSDKFT